MLLSADVIAGCVSDMQHYAASPQGYASDPDVEPTILEHVVCKEMSRWTEWDILQMKHNPDAVSTGTQIKEWIPLKDAGGLSAAPANSENMTSHLTVTQGY